MGGAALPIAAGIGAGGSILGGITGNKSAKRAAAVQEEMTRLAMAEQRRYWEEANAMYAPFRKAGVEATSDLLKYAQDPNASALYNLRLKEGETALARALKARGLYNSGVGVEQTRKLSETLSAEEAARKIAVMQGLAGTGAGIAQSAGGAAMQTGGALGGYLQNIGQSGAQAQYQMGLNRQGMFGDIAGIAGKVGGWYAGADQRNALMNWLGGGAPARFDYSDEPLKKEIISSYTVPDTDVFTESRARAAGGY